MSQVELGIDGSYQIRASHSNEEPLLVRCAAVFILFFNVLTCILGLALAGAGAYVIIEFNRAFAGLLSENAGIGVLVSGVMIALGTCVSIVAVMQSRRKLLIVNTFSLTIFLVAILSVLGLFVEYINAVGQVAVDGTVPVPTLRQIEVNDYFLSAYTKCCVQNTRFCPDQTACPRVSSCMITPGSKACYQGDYGASPSDPPVSIVNEFCSTMAAFGVVGPASNATQFCGSSEGGGQFIQDSFAFVYSNILYPYIAIGLLSFILTLDIICNLILIRHIGQVERGEYVGREIKAMNPLSIPTAYDPFARTPGDEGGGRTASLQSGSNFSNLSSGNPIFRRLRKADEPKNIQIVDAHPVPRQTISSRYGDGGDGDGDGDGD